MRWTERAAGLTLVGVRRGLAQSSQSRESHFADGYFERMRGNSGEVVHHRNANGMCSRESVPIFRTQKYDDLPKCVIDDYSRRYTFLLMH